VRYAAAGQEYWHARLEWGDWMAMLPWTRDAAAKGLVSSINGFLKDAESTYTHGQKASQEPGTNKAAY